MVQIYAKQMHKETQLCCQPSSSALCLSQWTA